MHAEVVYYCPKCKSLEIDIACVKPSEPFMLSIDNIINDRFICATNRYKATCLDCGYTVEYTR